MVPLTVSCDSEFVVIISAKLDRLVYPRHFERTRSTRIIDKLSGSSPPPSRMALFRGHDSNFVCKVADRFICQICTEVLREPHLAVCCGQHFCEPCLHRWFQQHRKESCPRCRAEGKEFSHVINKGLRSEINQLEVKCSNHGKGCKWTGELGALKTHLQSDKGCGFFVVKCPNRCSGGRHCSVKSMQRKDLDKHLNSECYLRPYQCEHCGCKDTYLKITGKGHPFVHYRTVWTGTSFRRKDTSHYDECQEFPLICPNKCGAESIKRKCMKRHRSECPQEPVQCPFAEAGCKEDVRRCQLESHMTSSVQQHLLLVMNDYKRLKEKLRQQDLQI